MDVAPTTETIISGHSFHSKHGALKGSRVCRPPSPDSACEQDHEWLNVNPVSGLEDMTSDMSEESGRKSSRTPGRRISMKEATLARRKFGETITGRGLTGQDSDVDSGIVACRKPGQRIGSTSSADTDSSQESRRRLERPPTPLTVFSDAHHCVRFDEQLQLSEQNIRRSCRKLFATLYAQRFSYPNHRDGSLLHGRACSGSTRLRSRTVPELDLRRCSHVSEPKPGWNHKANMDPEGRNPAWNHWTVHKSTSDASIGGKVSSELHTQHYKNNSYCRYNTDFGDSRTSHTNSAHSRRGSLKSSMHCTCHDRQSGAMSSQSTNRCTLCCCSCCKQQSFSLSSEPPPRLYKSNSCSTLPTVLSHQSRPHLTQFPSRTSPRKLSLGGKKSKPVSLQKTSSCSTLLDRVPDGVLVSNVPVYGDSMVQVYAHVASVVPDDIRSNCSSQNGRQTKTLGRLKYTRNNVCDFIWPSSYNSSSLYSNQATSSPVSRKMNSFGNDAVVSLEVPAHQETLLAPPVSPKSPNSSNNDADVESDHSVEIYSQIMDDASESLGKKSQRESLRSRVSLNHQRPKSVGVVMPNIGPNPVYLKSALKKPTQSAVLQVSDSSTIESQLVLNGGVNIPSEVEYAVVDKSKKNRLPLLNNQNSTSNTTEDKEKNPPVPPKKLSHKSDPSLYRSRSSSPKRSLLERMQTLTKNAKSALQKAFSTERIYRPEREERMEGQKRLQRSRSFIKSLTGSFRKKRRKSRTPMTEIMPQASSNAEWDEELPGSNQSNHVRGQILQLNLDGSQVVELMKPVTKPYGFFVARGRVRNSKGVFVSRMRDQETQKQLAGLLDIGDEILEIDGLHVKDADIMEVNRLMAHKNTLLLTVLPYISRKDV